MTSDTFATRLRALRKAAGLSVQDLAGQVGVTRQAVWWWEQGRSYPTVDVAWRLADALGIDLEQLRPGHLKQRICK